MKIIKSKKEVRITNVFFDEHDCQILSDCGIPIELVEDGFRYGSQINHDDGSQEIRNYNITKKE